MIARLASLVLRLYPSTWRMRYEEEVRALLADNPPRLRDLAGLTRAAVAERWYDLIDPAEHPLLAGVVLGLGGWAAAWFVMGASASAAKAVLDAQVGGAPEWAGIAGYAGILSVFARTMLAQAAFSEVVPRVAGRQVRFGPLSRLEARRWWVILWLSVVLGWWARIPLVVSVWLPPFWFWCVLTLWMSGEGGWSRARATQAIRRLRIELRDAIREYQRISRLVARGLAPAEAADAILREMDRLNQDVRRAGREYRRAQLRHLPADRPLGL